MRETAGRPGWGRRGDGMRFPADDLAVRFGVLVVCGNRGERCAVYMC
ncbi:hypothetical protein RISK_002304 [Rhodopirellula islandica]|uniref:Uncharacterized protein n=1 Tax=Rhodopirellula islandica TaxID=595434 RepID=A0A0J1BGJ6_RHOIS|nr:hypothetical protein RISK_002304 [Rhodopirellula islandica]